MILPPSHTILENRTGVRRWTPVFVGVWLSLARALRSGRRGRRFKSSHPDHFFAFFPKKTKKWSMKPVKASLHGAKRRFIFGGSAAKCFMRRKPRFIRNPAPP